MTATAKSFLLSCMMAAGAFGQAVTIGSPIFSGTGLNDAASGGAYTGVAANHYYTATISSAGTPDQFTLSRDSGSLTSALAITGSAQQMTFPGGTITGAACTGGIATYTQSADVLQPGDLATVTGAAPSGWNIAALRVLTATATTFTVNIGSCPGSWSSGGGVIGSNGVTITWAATTGHGVGDFWTVYVTANGSIGTSSFVQRGNGALVARNAQDKLRDTFSVKDFGPTPGNGATNDTAYIADCVAYAHAHGGVCEFPPGDYKTTRKIQITAAAPHTGYSDISVTGLSGVGHALSIGDATTAGNPIYMFGSRIICAVTTGDPCFDVDLTNTSFVTLLLRGLAFVGPDTGPGGAVSGSAVRVHGGAEPRMLLEDVGCGGFYGSGSFCFDIDGAEGSRFQDLLCQGANACLHGYDAFNGNRIVNLASSNTTGPEAVLFNLGSFGGVSAVKIDGGTIQASAGNGITLNGTDAVKIDGTYFECNNVGAGFLGNGIACGVPGAPTTSAPSAGGACNSGTHLWAVSFIGPGGETRAGYQSVVQACGGGNGTEALSAIPTGPAGTTARNIYRTKAGTIAPFYLDCASSPCIANNASTTYSDALADASLGAASPGQNGGAIVFRADAGVFNQYANVSDLHLSSVTDKIVCFRASGSGLGNLYGRFEESYLNGVGFPQVSLDSSCAYTRGENFSGAPGEIFDSGTDNQWCYGSTCANYNAQPAGTWNGNTLGGPVFLGNDVSTFTDGTTQYDHRFGDVGAANYFYTKFTQNGGGAYWTLGVDWNAGGELDVLHACGRFGGIGVDTLCDSTHSIVAGRGINVLTGGYDVNGVNVIDGGRVGTFASGTTIGGTTPATKSIGTASAITGVTVGTSCSSASSSFPITITCTSTVTDPGHTHTQN